MADDALANYRADRERLRAQVAAIDAGTARHFEYDEDGAPYETTDEVRFKIQRILDLMDRLIAAAEAARQQDA